MQGGIDLSRATLGQRHRVGTDRRQGRSLGGLVLTQGVMGLVRQTRKGLRVVDAFAV
jgi:hypothetical protein